MSDDKHRLKARALTTEWLMDARKAGSLIHGQISRRDYEQLEDRIRDALAESAREGMERAAMIALTVPLRQGRESRNQIAEAIRKQTESARRSN